MQDVRQFEKFWEAELERRRAGGRLRALRGTERLGGGRIRVQGRVLLDFSSNDYLGLTRHPALAEGAARYAEQWGVGAGASRLVCGNLEPLEALEAKIARAKGSEAALVLASGWQANASILPALLDPRMLPEPPLVFSDELNHASMHHGCRAAKVRVIGYRHLDLDHLESELRAHQASTAPKFILSETVFSMDGDRADVSALIEIAERHGAFLYLDEAHATGVLGESGYGLTAGFGDRVGLVVGTFSKALGSFGAYAACSATLRAYLVNRCSGVVYSTALPTPLLGAIDAAWDLLPTLDAERARLHENAERLRRHFAKAGLDVSRSTTQIVPAILGSDERAVALAASLEEAGFLALPIRPPTVPEGTSRIRFTLSAHHRPEDVDRLAEVVRAAL